MSEYAVDVTIKVLLSTEDNPCGDFNEDEFIRATRDYITLEEKKTWFIKKEGLQAECSNDK